MDGDRPHRFTAFGSAAFSDSIMGYCLPTSTGIPSGQDKNVAQLGWQTTNNMGCAAREPEPAGRVQSNALLIPGSTGASCAAGTNPNGKLTTHKQRVLKISSDILDLHGEGGQMAGGEVTRKRLNCTDALPVRYCAVRVLHCHLEG